MIYREQVLERAEAERIDFGYVDAKGRRIGCALYRVKVEWVEAPDAKWGWKVPRGQYRLCVQAERNGVSYGACQADQYFESEEAREAAVAKYLAGAKKRAAKLAA